MIPTATELPALAEYFYSFIGESAPVFDVRKEMNISVKKYSPGYDLTTGYQTFVYYGVSWDKVYGEDAIYTLTVYDSGDFAHTVYPVRTVTAGEDALAYVGEVVITQGRTVSYFESDLCHGTKTFIVNVITPDKRMYTSCPLEYTFD